MLYTYCKNTLCFKQLKPGKRSVIGSLIFLTITLLGLYIGFHKATANAYSAGMVAAIQTIEPELIVVELEAETFKQEDLVNELKRLNVRFPHIVLAQAILETGYYESRVFQENNNLFGMKQARARSTTAAGTQLGHAYYDHWKESVVDYALYQNAYVNKIRNEAKYLKYLDKNYAEAKNYDEKLKTIIEREQLEELFLD